ncbi:integrase arm-type DNA-binding domain-containing protein [Glaciimonas sp. PAMC28666]|uniref:tyrosine-type recombinase/integrase n=1 Tax=Glaciimonas sp. PAMC28666 TaxID=2807626 RepID=UPI0019647206|nr:integrase arm-type DNA-binding domain-containing protein [Glaciimonas sp. PAMC28666]QRX83250.1 integrase arm-type DNA-binding domain-containing protein [Glaciimonas sp. PAMC28666]
MPKLATPLTDIQVRTAKPKDKSYTLADGGGMYLEVTPSGSKIWRMAYRQPNGKNTRLTFGAYPTVTLVAARKKRDEARALKEAGTDPAQARRIDKITKGTASANTFEAIAREWHANKSDTWKERTADNILHRLEVDVFPLIGKQPIAGIKAPIMLDVLRQIEKRGALEMAKRQGQVCGQIFRYAIATGVADNDPLPSLKGALKQTMNGHHAAITPDELPAFIRAFEKIEGHMFIGTRVMFRLMMMTFVRTSELIETPWSEIDLENEEWVIDWHRMKQGKKKVNPRKVDHHVFLPAQGWLLLRELHQYTGGGKHLFPNQRDPTKPTSNGAILAALKRMDYAGKHTGHGFRSLAMGVIKERLGYRHEVVDRQLSHASGDAYGEAYDRAMFLDERKIMMQRYADYLETVAGGKVIPGKFGRTA